jgi:hypothetical protein
MDVVGDEGTDRGAPEAELRAKITAPNQAHRRPRRHGSRACDPDDRHATRTDLAQTLTSIFTS